ncbi:hypothetical protein C5F59_036225 [Streptomyces sp. QL37]|uniref:hypothetical protein n=1 Tax=Streptomyces sp. QL37 TaxID=2093747 RepID=UPI000CF2D266|nr:hypothetical protein [Streptomyces sp. QL37]PPQ61598.1 hypothetical protein C5F59_36720 [Streptomyces sp. QL37]
MCLFRYESEPEPEEPLPAGRPYVPVRPGDGERATARLFRAPLGTRTAAGLTSGERRAATQDRSQASLPLPESLPRTSAPVR